MSCGLFKKIKIFFIIALVLLVAGFTMFGVFGFNQPIDYKSSYEVQVSVDQKAGNTTTVLKDAADEYFSETGIKVLNYATQSIDDGMVVIYKFNSNVTEDVAGLKEYIQAKLDAESNVSNVSADVVVNESIGNNSSSIGKLLIALGIAVALIFVYSLIMNKLAGAVSVIFASVLSGVMFVAIVALTRIPAAPFFAFSCALSIIVSSVLSVVLTSKYKVFVKNYDKMPSSEIIETVYNKSLRNYIFVGGIVLVSALALCAFMLPYAMFAGAQVLVAGLCGISSAIFATPFMWSLIKKSK